MPPPSDRVIQLLRTLRDLRPDQARAFLGQALRALDAAEQRSLQALLPPGLSSPVASGATSAAGPRAESNTTPLPANEMPTIMNVFPMPWEMETPAQVSTAEFVRSVHPRTSKWKVLALSAAATFACFAVPLMLVRPASSAGAAHAGPAPVEAAADATPDPEQELVPLPKKPATRTAKRGGKALAAGREGRARSHSEIDGFGSRL